MLPHIFNGVRGQYLLLFTTAGSIAALVAFVAGWLGAQFGARLSLRPEQARSAVSPNAVKPRGFTLSEALQPGPSFPVSEL